MTSLYQYDTLHNGKVDKISDTKTDLPINVIYKKRPNHGSIKQSCGAYTRGLVDEQGYPTDTLRVQRISAISLPLLLLAVVAVVSSAYVGSTWLENYRVSVRGDSTMWDDPAANIDGSTASLGRVACENKSTVRRIFRRFEEDQRDVGCRWMVPHWGHCFIRRSNQARTHPRSVEICDQARKR